MLDENGQQYKVRGRSGTGQFLAGTARNKELYLVAVILLYLAVGVGAVWLVRTVVGVRGDATLFDRGDNVEAAWALVDPILDVWSAAKSAGVPPYAGGSWGPREADVLLERDGRRWYNP